MKKITPTLRLYHDVKLDFLRYRQRLYPGGKKGFLIGAFTLFRSPGLMPVLLHRFGFWVNTRFIGKRYLPVKAGLKAVYFIGKYLCVCFFKTDISIAADIKGGIFISNKGNIMLGGHKIGENCTFHHNVTLGQGRDRKEPVLGNNVWVGPDSILYGGITIGSNCYITASSSISRNIPDGIMIGGNPCRLIKKGLDDRIHPIEPKIPGLSS